ncbi:MAG: glycosyltransferase family 4 protein [Aigarchaeota archaeon]|nr:glycosyltransferase family 4 protein [Candidatus Pelearchaeum maunauluense]
MRILLISPTMGGLGGIAQHVEELGEKLHERGFEVYYVTSNNTLVLRVRRLANPSFALFAALKVLGEKYDIIHAHNIPSAIPMRLASGRRILTIHGIYSRQVILLHGGAVGRAAGWLERRAIKWADAVTVVSREAAEAYSAMGFEVAHIPNAIDLKKLPSDGIRMGAPQVAYVGRLSREKGVDTLIKAAQLVGRARFIIVGSGPAEEGLRRAAHNLDNVTFLGAMSRWEAQRIIRGSDIFVLPSRAEGLSTALLEAMAMRTPVVATNVGGNVELVSHMKTGLLVEPDSPQQLAEAINTLLDDKELASRMAEEAYSLILREYSWDVVIGKYLELYERVLTY